VARAFVILGSAMMFLAVGAGAFGAHALEGYFTDHPDLKSSYDIAVRYHQIHALAVLFVAWAVEKWPGPPTSSAGVLFIVGIVVFSGSLYLLSLTDLRWLGAITPIGGLAFLAGWLLLIISVLRS